MNSWEKLPIGELFSLEKGSLQSTKCTPGAYTFITASSDWKTHNGYSHDCEALIYAVAASGSLGRCHHYNGKFISSDLCFILRAKDEKNRPINYRFYQNVFRFLKDDIVAKTKAGTSKESISQKRFSAYTLPYIDIEHQSYWEDKLNNLNDKIENFEIESIIQSSCLTKLRQAILQEAIEGKLTADWRKENPVRKGDPDYDSEALLVKIQAEKEKLIKKGKIKKQKPLAPIKAEEVPFELPEGWVWTRLEYISSVGTGATPLTTEETYYKNGTINWITSSSTGSLFIEHPDKLITEKAIQETNCQIYPINTLVIAMYGQGKTRGQISDLKIPAATNQALAAIQLYLIADSHRTYIKHFFMNHYLEIRKLASGGAQPNLNMEKVKTTFIPLPPLAEQQAIVDRVEKLLSMVDELEKQVSERKEQSEQLMQAVLREAFEGGM